MKFYLSKRTYEETNPRFTDTEVYEYLTEQRVTDIEMHPTFGWTNQPTVFTFRPDDLVCKKQISEDLSSDYIVYRLWVSDKEQRYVDYINRVAASGSLIQKEYVNLYLSSFVVEDLDKTDERVYTDQALENASRSVSHFLRDTSHTLAKFITDCKKDKLVSANPLLEWNCDRSLIQLYMRHLVVDFALHRQTKGVESFELPGHNVYNEVMWEQAKVYGQLEAYLDKDTNKIEIK
jgi:hypothetical protein